MANLWVNTAEGDSPKRCKTACRYDSARAYGSFAEAAAAAESGDTIRVKAGKYGRQGASATRARR